MTSRHAFGFSLTAEDGAARCGVLRLGAVEATTPVFMPVGTIGTVKGIRPEELEAMGTRLILANAYHLMLRPGAERAAALGGLHRLSRWPHGILTDSGGFQVMSLAALARVEDEGVEFRSHIDGTRVALTPERAIEVQALLGSDIAMVLDECIALPADEARAAEAMRRSCAWAERSVVAWNADARVSAQTGHALFGIVQGGGYKHLRSESAERLGALGLPGLALGGLAVGEPQAQMFEVLEHTVPLLEPAKPRYLMGIGMPLDIVGAVARGMDMFDCVLPTRLGRTGTAFVGCGRLNLRNRIHRDDPQTLEAECPCVACARGFSRAWLHHLVRAREMLGAQLLTHHNLVYYRRLTEALGAAIRARRLAAFARAFAERAGREAGGVPARQTFASL